MEEKWTGCRDGETFIRMRKLSFHPFLCNFKWKPSAESTREGGTKLRIEWQWSVKCWTPLPGNITGRYTGPNLCLCLCMCVCFSHATFGNDFQTKDELIRDNLSNLGKKAMSPDGKKLVSWVSSQGQGKS